MGSIGRSIRVLKISLRVLSHDRELLLLPLACAALFAVPAAALWTLAWAGRHIVAPAFDSRGLIMLAFFVIVPWVVCFFGMSINAAIISAASIRLDGGDPSVRDGIAAALRHRGALARWALYTVTVGALVRMAGRVFGSIGETAASLAWAAATFFVIPAIVVDGRSARDARAQSLTLARQRFGDSLVGASAIGFLFFVAVMLFWIVFVLTEIIPPHVGVPAAAGLSIVAIVAGTTLSGIFQAAFYRYVTTGDSGAFSEHDLPATVRRR